VIKMINEDPRMFDDKATFANVTLKVDPINRDRSENSDNVMAMFYEEQPFMWEYVKSKIDETIKSLNAPIDFLDVGTGSGVWSILVCKNLGAKKVKAIDKSPRAIEHAKINAKSNKVTFDVQRDFYNMGSAKYRSCKVIGIYVPYHLYPKEIEEKIPQHARGGVYGQQIFREQLCVADYHLAEGGSIVFNQMCLGKNGKPEFVNYIPQLVRGTSVEYINIFPPMKTKEFLDKIYEGRFPEYVEKISKEFPELYYCDGIITRDGKNEIKEIKHNIDLKGRTWNDRIDLHNEIAKHGF
jgi:hypothetical protein